MRQLRRHRRAVLLPAIAWLAIQIAMASGFAVAAPAGVERGASTIWICTGVGMRLVSLDGGVPDDATTADPGSSCYWCQAFASAKSPDGPAGAAARHLIRSDRAVSHNTPEKVRAARASAFQSRAPPLDFAA